MKQNPTEILSGTDEKNEGEHFCPPRGCDVGLENVDGTVFLEGLRGTPCSTTFILEMCLKHRHTEHVSPRRSPYDLGRKKTSRKGSVATDPSSSCTQRRILRSSRDSHRSCQSVSLGSECKFCQAREARPGWCQDGGESRRNLHVHQEPSAELLGGTEGHPAPAWGASAGRPCSCGGGRFDLRQSFSSPASQKSNVMSHEEMFHRRSKNSPMAKSVWNPSPLCHPPGDFQGTLACSRA